MDLYIDKLIEHFMIIGNAWADANSKTAEFLISPEHEIIIPDTDLIQRALIRKKILDREASLREEARGINEQSDLEVKIHGAFADVLETRTKPYLIDPLISHCLFTRTHASAQQYPESIGLPHPFTFFEFQKPIPIDLSMLMGKEYKIAGIFVYKTDDMNSFGRPYIGHEGSITEGFYEVMICLTSFSPPQPILSFNPLKLPVFNFNVFNLQENREHVYCIDPVKGVSWNVSDLLSRYKKMREPPDEEVAHHLEPITPEMMDLRRIADLAINLINYASATNVHEVENQRTKTVRKRIGKKRGRRKGKIVKVEVPAPPYWTFKIDEPDSQPRETTGTREYRNRWMVDAHARFNRDGTRCTYVIPHVKGPLDQPWYSQRSLDLFDELFPLLMGYNPGKYSRLAGEPTISQIKG